MNLHQRPADCSLDLFCSLLQILCWFVQISLGLKHIHDSKILHRDIKSQVAAPTHGLRRQRLLIFFWTYYFFTFRTFFSARMERLQSLGTLEQQGHWVSKYLWNSIFLSIQMDKVFVLRHCDLRWQKFHYPHNFRWLWMNLLNHVTACQWGPRYESKLKSACSSEFDSQNPLLVSSVTPAPGRASFSGLFCHSHTRTHMCAHTQINESKIKKTFSR